MNHFFDELSRRMANAMPRRALLQRAGITIVGGAVFGGGVLPAEAQMAPDFSPLFTKIRSLYLAGDAYQYRRHLFGLFLLLKRATAPTLLTLLDGLTAYIKKYGNTGFEPILLTLADGIASRGNATAKAKTKASLAAVPAAYRLTHTIAWNIRLPLTRLDGLTALNIRGDAMSVMVKQLFRWSDGVPGAPATPNLDDIMSAASTKNDMCKQPPAPTQNLQIAPEDKERQTNCAKTGRPGGSPASGTSVGQMFGDIEACFFGTPSEIDKMQKQLTRMEACADSLAGPGPGGGGGPGGGLFIAPVVIAGALVAAAVAIATLVSGTKDGKDLLDDVFIKPWRDFNDALVKSNADVQAWTRAEQDVQKAESAYEDAKDNLNDAKSDVESAKEKKAYYDSQPVTDANTQKQAKAQQQLEEAQEREQGAKKEVERTDKALKDAEARAKEKEDAAKKSAAEAEAKNPSKASDTAPGAEGSKACSDIFGVNEHMMADKFGKDFTDWKARFKKVSMPTPDSPGENPLDGAAMPFCGIDSQTTNSLAGKCNSLVLCPEGQMPDETCGCRGTASGAARVAAKMAARACATEHCPPETTPVGRGFICTCGMPDEAAGKVPPRPVGPMTLTAGMGMTHIPTAALQNPSLRAVKQTFDTSTLRSIQMQMKPGSGLPGSKQPGIKP